MGVSWASCLVSTISLLSLLKWAVFGRATCLKKLHTNLLFHKKVGVGCKLSGVVLYGQTVFPPDTGPYPTEGPGVRHHPFACHSTVIIQSGFFLYEMMIALEGLGKQARKKKISKIQSSNQVPANLGSKLPTQTASHRRASCWLLSRINCQSLAGLQTTTVLPFIIKNLCCHFLINTSAVIPWTTFRLHLHRDWCKCHFYPAFVLLEDRSQNEQLGKIWKSQEQNGVKTLRALLGTDS